MATVRTAHTVWSGDLPSGSGQVTLDSSGLGTYDVTWKARAEDAGGKTSPEELIAAAHSACFSMAFSNALGEEGNTPERVETTAEVDFQPGTGITAIRLTLEASVPGLAEEDFQRIAQAAKEGCPVSQALAGVKDISLSATLNS
ncbi:OsmC family protein [Arthrobacter agilis]|uniref:OsmC family protein n=1 Tax=Arthrobacter agilis TaxID=37921 RepID=UPI000B35818B|nr:OsmC family protein [Arthrobacter agilis]OUM45417.1 peroxiredoxin [Arthrobacter agilis]PPB46955.1 OsmC family peroxiredoxin [Arthrobacter agilis]TPV23451.1 OsmC family protein [Arthrobacter agilis]WDF34580.1 OsmC family protein [Arthrobacter agilis]VDR31837.1 Peroxiredoxin osmC [Arthrobacter agilis]